LKPVPAATANLSFGSRLPTLWFVASKSFLRGRRVRREYLLEIREVIEPECAALAAVRASSRALDRMEVLNRSMKESLRDAPTLLTPKAEWHIGIAEAAENEFLPAFMIGISKEIRHSPLTWRASILMRFLMQYNAPMKPSGKLFERRICRRQADGCGDTCTPFAKPRTSMKPSDSTSRNGRPSTAGDGGPRSYGWRAA
jgi:hypothetical protein